MRVMLLPQDHDVCGFRNAGNGLFCVRGGVVVLRRYGRGSRDATSA